VTSGTCFSKPFGAGAAGFDSLDFEDVRVGKQVDLQVARIGDSACLQAWCYIRAMPLVNADEIPGTV
jgi:hypothetical protein